MEEKVMQMVREHIKAHPIVIGIEHNALVCDVGGGRIMLIAMSDLADMEEMERMKEEEERMKQMEFMRYEQQRMEAGTDLSGE